MSHHLVVPITPERVAALADSITGSGEQFTSTVVFTADTFATLREATTHDVERAAATARAVQREWAKRPVSERTAVLARFHDLVLEHTEDLLDLIQIETGKARGHAFDEVLDTCANARYYANAAPVLLGDRRHAGALPLLTKAVEVRHPLGLIGVISPWNYPLSLAVSEALPALVAGNGVLHMPDRQTALILARGRELAEQAGLPVGLWQIVVGDPARVGRDLIEQVDHVLFTGSTATGRLVAAQAAERLIGTSLELGGKNPMIVCADADLDQAVAGAVRVCFASTGQLCMGVERLLLHRDIAEQFTERFVAATAALSIGAGFNHDHQIGSLTSSKQLARVQRHVDDAVALGAEVLTGGRHRPDLGPYFYEPTVLTAVPREAICTAEETFGPVVSIRVVADDDEAVALANDSEFGLNASVWGSSARVQAIARRLRSGMVNLNEGFSAAWGSTGLPVGGVGLSGTGRRHGRAGIDAVTWSQAIAEQRGMSLGEDERLDGRNYQRVMQAGLRALKVLRHRD